jgi:ribosomal protein S15P/S13E
MAIKKTSENSEKIKKPVETKEKISQEEFEKKVLELAEKGLTSEKIGETLRKQGIHSKEYDKKISKILGNHYKNPDIINVNQKLEKIKKHYEKNPQDKRAMREKDRVFSQIRKMKKYLKIPN